MAPSRQDPRFTDDRLRLYAQVTFGDAYELEDPWLREVQGVWESFGDPPVATPLWLDRLRATAAAMRQRFGADAWIELLETGWRFMAHQDYATRDAWVKEAEAARNTPSEAVRKLRRERLSEAIHARYARPKISISPL